MERGSGMTRALVLRAPGINCDRETAQACRIVGFETELVHINQLIKSPEKLLDYHFLVFPGGFSYGDDLGAGKLLEINLLTHLGPQLRRFIDEGRPMLGICNGFQVLVRAGLLPDTAEATSLADVEQAQEQSCSWNDSAATLTENGSGQFECRWVTLSPQPGVCVFTRGIEHPIELPVAHGEGQFVFKGDLDALRANGPMGNIAGICNARGNVFGLMPHPERYVHALQHPQRRATANGEGDGLLI